MMRFILAGLAIAAVVALGQMPTAQLHAFGLFILAWLLLHWAVLLPWLLSALFARLWWRQRELRNELERIAEEGVASAHQSLRLARKAVAEAYPRNSRKRARR